MKTAKVKYQLTGAWWITGNDRVIKLFLSIDDRQKILNRKKIEIGLKSLERVFGD